MVGKLETSLYGTRDAAVNFQEEVAKFMKIIGYTEGKYNPCTYWHEKRKLRTLVHGSDFVTVGKREDVEWLKNQMGRRFEIKTKI